MEHVIAFPALGLEWAINRVAFQVLGKPIYWYGIIICIGFILAAAYITRRVPQFGITVDDAMNIMLIAVPAAIVCARIYYVIFAWDYYRENLSEIWKTWNGGIAIYGGIIGAMLVILVYCRVRHISSADAADIACLGLLIGQAIGRWGNFVNAEAHGGETSLPWGMSIDGAASVHPTFLYESVWNLLGFVMLHFLSKKRKFSGQIFLGYIAWYGFGRMLIEGLRTDSLYIGSSDVRVSQVLAGASCILAIFMMIQRLRQQRPTAVPTEIQIPDNTTTEE